MEQVSVDKALDLVSGTLFYQYKTAFVLGLTAFGFSSFHFAFPYLINEDPKISSFSNTFELTIDGLDDKNGLKNRYYFAVPLGCLIFSFLNDKLGRLTTLHFSVKWFSVSLLFSSIAFTVSVLDYTVASLGLLFLNGCIGTFLLISESVSSKDRIFFSSAVVGSWNFSKAVTSALFYFKINWRIFLLGLFGISILIYYLLGLVFESPKYLFHTGRTIEVSNNLTEISSINKKGKFDRDLLPEAIECRKKNYFSLFDRKNFKKVLSCFVFWMNWFMIYRALNLDQRKILGDQYLNAVYVGGLQTISIVFVGVFGSFLKASQNYFIFMVFGRTLAGFIEISGEGRMAYVLIISAFWVFYTAELFYLLIVTQDCFSVDVSCMAFGLCSVLGKIGEVLVFDFVIVQNGAFSGALKFGCLVILLFLSVFIIK